MSEQPPRIVIAGAGHAGGSAAAFLRQYGWKGGITLVGEEANAPYQRPPLSKAWLKGEATAESLALRPARFYAQQNIELRLGTRLEVLDRAAKRLVLSDGTALGYDRLILALGARPRALPLPGADLAGVLALRGTIDADALQAALKPGARLAVIGGGYIGLEVAASARALGAGAVVIEREARVLARVAGADLSAFLERAHRARGVEIVTGAQVQAIEGQDGAARAVLLQDGTRIPADTVLVGIGAMPNLELAREAGLDCGAGIVVDLAARTSDPAIYAIGDCTQRPLPLYDRAGRLESVPNAIEQAKQAAADLCGRPPPPPEVPWFWSDQFELRLQMAGLAFDARETVVRGDMAADSFAVFHLDAAQRVLAVEAVNAPTDFMAGRLLVAKQARVAPDLLRDTATPLKDLAA
ncbi:NAD(P)/FAD-dependent oxidoreductase [Paracraurococcus ruber]|uniref:Ferredoxin reductase n=1 Tax=Paracraurococcus ruber TaxID=77675 RepID=A0ABS1CVH3_9PROT|nr:FAD-dependent oxidoreductase [Paracraurococcus ruber]MBK1658306.1 ferredoxin reductase [Paracraurococcus ruber]TDG30924.1 ferredoxin reductase [Paracraurococcus ruber]